MFRSKRNQHRLLAALGLAVMIVFALVLGDGTGLFGAAVDHAPATGGNEWIEAPLEGGNDWSLVSQTRVTTLPADFVNALMRLIEQISGAY